MTDFLKMDVFFFVTTFVVIALGVVVFLIGLRIWRILGHVEHISEMAEEETELLKGDIATFRSQVRREGFKFKSLVRMFKSIFTKSS
ncbi:hypothetical protein C4568_03910 [Candidatus Parcubacteria bacterium]|nr:MAG: hypothetical protein C4568_03910 [Candidatus Parcubacteria bacterium]